VSVVHLKLRKIDIFYEIDNSCGDLVKAAKINVKLYTPLLPSQVKNIKF